MSLEAWTALNAADAPRPGEALLFIRAHGGPRAVLAETPAGATPAARAWLERARAFDAARELELVERHGARVVSIDDPDYPELLRSVKDAPLALYLKGDLPADGGRRAAAVVGSRAPSAYGKRVAERLGAEFADLGWAVVSGLARGIDTAAHRGALAGGGPTWAVLGSGLDRMYPAENADLARAVAARGGCVLSEFPFGTAPRGRNFPRRNRIVAGLAQATVVVEGRKKSGSSITAQLALENGRDVGAVPGAVDSALSYVPNLLLRAGAFAVTTAGDVVMHAGCDLPPDFIAAAAPRTDEERLLDWLGRDGLDAAEIARRSGWEYPRVARILFELECRRAIARQGGVYTKS